MRDLQRSRKFGNFAQKRKVRHTCDRGRPRKESIRRRYGVTTLVWTRLRTDFSNLKLFHCFDRLNHAPDRDGYNGDRVTTYGSCVVTAPCTYETWLREKISDVEITSSIGGDRICQRYNNMFENTSQRIYHVELQTHFVLPVRSTWCYCTLKKNDKNFETLIRRVRRVRMILLLFMSLKHALYRIHFYCNARTVRIAENWSAVYNILMRYRLRFIRFWLV